MSFPNTCQVCGEPLPNGLIFSEQHFREKHQQKQSSAPNPSVDSVGEILPSNIRAMSREEFDKSITARRDFLMQEKGYSEEEANRALQPTISFWLSCREHEAPEE